MSRQAMDGYTHLKVENAFVGGIDVRYCLSANTITVSGGANYCCLKLDEFLGWLEVPVDQIRKAATSLKRKGF